MTEVSGFPFAEAVGKPMTENFHRSFSRHVLDRHNRRLKGENVRISMTAEIGVSYRWINTRRNKRKCHPVWRQGCNSINRRDTRDVVFGTGKKKGRRKSTRRSSKKERTALWFTGRPDQIRKFQDTKLNRPENWRDNWGTVCLISCRPSSGRWRRNVPEKNTGPGYTGEIWNASRITTGRNSDRMTANRIDFEGKPGGHCDYLGTSRNANRQKKPKNFWTEFP